MFMAFVHLKMAYASKWKTVCFLFKRDQIKSKENMFNLPLSACFFLPCMPRTVSSSLSRTTTAHISVWCTCCSTHFDFKWFARSIEKRWNIQENKNYYHNYALMMSARSLCAKQVQHVLKQNAGVLLCVLWNSCVFLIHESLQKKNIIKKAYSTPVLSIAPLCRTKGIPIHLWTFIKAAWFLLHSGQVYIYLQKKPFPFSNFVFII